MNVRLVAKIRGDQDGAIYGSELFRFDSLGNCAVYDLKEIKDDEVTELTPRAEFRLDGADVIVPHSNAVCFGCGFYDENDEYPLLYTNIYNNFAKEEDKLIGVCCVYRLQRTENKFTAILVQLIEIGFTEDSELWKAYPDKHGVRPYGNFVVDGESRSYYAFVMRSEEKGTRYFRFDLPSVNDGEIDTRFNVKKVVLSADDIRDTFDLGYSRYVQGAIFHEGKIYSTEGFHKDIINRPAIRVIDTVKKEEEYFDILDIGFVNEPEFIDFYNGTCYYSDASGNLYTVEE